MEKTKNDGCLLTFCNFLLPNVAWTPFLVAEPGVRRMDAEPNGSISPLLCTATPNNFFQANSTLKQISAYGRTTTEHQSFCRSSELAPRSPPLPASVSSPAPRPPGVEGTHSHLRGRGWGEPIETKGQTLWYSIY
jgi:hypothetical protein